MSGSVLTSKVSIKEESGNFGELKDVILTSVAHNNTISYDSTNWVNT